MLRSIPGLPNHMCPTQGYISKLRQVLQEQQLRGKNLPSIHTFGFGNDIRSGLLQTIAELGAGTFSFIPDIGMLGNVPPDIYSGEWLHPLTF